MKRAVKPPPFTCDFTLWCLFRLDCFAGIQNTFVFAGICLDLSPLTITHMAFEPLAGENHDTRSVG